MLTSDSHRSTERLEPHQHAFLQTALRLHCKVLLFQLALQSAFAVIISKPTSPFLYMYLAIEWHLKCNTIPHLFYRCLGILFDIFPDVVISYLVSSKSLDGHQGEDPHSSPRGILSRLLVCNQVALFILFIFLFVVIVHVNWVTLRYSFGPHSNIAKSESIAVPLPSILLHTESYLTLLHRPSLLLSMFRLT